MQEESHYSRNFGNDISHLHAFPPSLSIAIFVSQSFPSCHGPFAQLCSFCHLQFLSLSHVRELKKRGCHGVEFWVKCGRRSRLVLKIGAVSSSGGDWSCGRWKCDYLKHVHLVLPFDKVTGDKHPALNGTAFGEVGMYADKGQNGRLESRGKSTPFQRWFPPSSWIAPIFSTFGCQDSVVSLSTRVDMYVNKSLKTFKELSCHANAKYTAACIQRWTSRGWKEEDKETRIQISLWP